MSDQTLQSVAANANAVTSYAYVSVSAPGEVAVCKRPNQVEVWQMSEPDLGDAGRFNAAPNGIGGPATPVGLADPNAAYSTLKTWTDARGAADTTIDGLGTYWPR